MLQSQEKEPVLRNDAGCCGRVASLKTEVVVALGFEGFDPFAHLHGNDRRAHHNDELGVVEKQPVETADGYDLVTVARIRPGKDKGQYAEYAWGRRKR